MTVLKRVDIVLVERGFYESRAQAKSAISAGLVQVNDREVGKASMLITEDSTIVAEREHPYVSRGGVKLSAALDHFALNPADCVCLDVGASTGGFTDVLLRRHARHVFAVDVGHDQFHQSLRNHPKVTVFEGQDARKLEFSMFSEPPSFIVCDVSFISLDYILPHVLSLVKTGSVLVALIKPQFEMGRTALKNGIVRDQKVQRAAVEKISKTVLSQGWLIHGILESPIKGGDGNIEYLLAAELSRA
jgi:23S rRNA (cytidine1920-2'-O)/16S rRNA (cytidine1409-2'-O)-methyltransferase